ncbi:hypothetical protein [Aliarcobacter vitoriensis]|uniref:Uncharacterized protein n=1 Tax=Aliarcobacter vitoriensis TaxID=2011099 RepID=A0A366MRC7_9BACT|nr:hypothetical protein [Aliarcobacter vitoriensis]RBQ28393.1 hypothetical protein CRU91_09235 [Aliarcobacter vitoriensis]
MDKEIKVIFKKENLLRFKQEWMTAKTDEIDCVVCSELEGTKLQIMINGDSYVADVADIANDLIEKVISK